MDLDFNTVTQFFGKLTLSTLLPALIYLIGGLIISRLILSFLDRVQNRSKVDVTLRSSPYRRKTGDAFHHLHGGGGGALGSRSHRSLRY